MSKEKKLIIHSLTPALLFLALIWIIKAGEIVTQFNLHFLGIFPLKLSGMIGIITAPMIHSDLKHLAANSLPLLILGSSLFYFYKEIAVKSMVLIYLLPGFFVWLGGREAYHIGASGVVYGLAGFLFFSGVFRREGRLLAITLLVTFLYGSLVWGIFPGFYPDEKISFESHFWGLVSGTLIAFHFRKQGPKRKKYDWEIEEELEQQLENTSISGREEKDAISVRYISPRKPDE